MFKFKKQSKHPVQVGEVYKVHGVAYEITRVGDFQRKPVAYGVSVNGGSEEALFYLEALETESTRKYIKKIT